MFSETNKFRNQRGYLRIMRYGILLLAIALFVIVPVYAQQNVDSALFISNQGGTWSLYTLSLETGEVQALPIGNLLNGYIIRNANLSPDSTKLAFVATDYLENGDFFDNVFWLDLLTGHVTRVTDNTRDDSGLPRWSPDGTQLAYLSIGPDGEELRLYTPATGEDVLATDSSVGPGPDGTYIAFGGFQGYDWSPDGQQFAIAMQMPGDEISIVFDNLLIINTDGTNPRLISFPYEADIRTPQWSLNTDAIYVTCRFISTEYDSICRLDPTSGELTTLLYLDRTVINDSKTHTVGTLDVSSDNQLVFSTALDDNLYLFDIQTHQMASLPMNTQDDGLTIFLGQIDRSAMPPVPTETPTPAS